MMNLISRKDAHAKGLKRFFTGKICKRGHLLERNVRTGACLGCLAHYAREYNAKMAGAVAHAVQIDHADIAAVDAFVTLLNLARTRGTEAPLVPPDAHVASVNTMIRMLSAPPAAPAPAAVADPRHAMWVRIHGREVADQMLANGL